MPASHACVELLESRKLLSSSVGVVAATTAPAPPAAIVPIVGKFVSIPVTIQTLVGDRFTGDVGMLRGLDPSVLPRLTARINWGDSSPVSGGRLAFDPAGLLHVQGIHTYARTGMYRVHVSVILNPPPGSMIPSVLYQIDSMAAVTRSTSRGVTISPTAGQLFRGSVGSFTAPWIDQSASPVQMAMDAMIDWGDGVKSAGTIVRNASGEYRVVGAHTYAEAGRHGIRVMVTAHAAVSPAPAAVPTDAVLVAYILSEAIVRPAPVVL